MSRIVCIVLTSLLLLSSCATTNTDNAPQLQDDYAGVQRTSSGATNTAATMMSPLTHY